MFLTNFDGSWESYLTDFSEKVHHCSFLDDKFLNNEPGYNPFYREGVDLKVLGIDVLEDPKQALGSSVIRGFAFVLINLIVDIFYTLADPRVRHD